MKKLLILSFILPFFAFAQEADTSLVQLDEVVIAENRIQLPFEAQSRSITLLSRDILTKKPVISIADAMRYAGGVDVRTRGVHGIQSDIGIRGGTFDQTLVLINGIKISDPQTGHHSFNLPVDLQSIDRIEVLKGPGARTFGQNAFSGAINIVTESPAASFLKARMQGGDFSLWGGGISGAWVGNGQSHVGSISYDQSAGYKHNTDYTMLNAFYNGKINFGGGKLELLGGYTDRAFGANGFYASPNFTEQYEEVKTALAAVSYKTSVGTAALEARGYYRQNDDDYIFIRDNPEFYHNVHVNKTLGVEVNTVIPFTNATTGIGIDLNRVSLESNNLGSRERFVATMFLEHRMEMLDNRLNITPGVQLNNYSDFGFNALPGIDIGYQITEKMTTFGNLGYTYRVPTFTDLYYTDPVNDGNPDLEPEYAWNYEIGIKTRHTHTFSGQVSFFLRDGSNMIDWTRAADTLAWKPVNVLKLRMAGIDASGTLSFSNLLKSENPLFNSLNFSYTYIDANAETPETGLSRYALENLKHQLRVGITLNYGRYITHVISYSYYDRVNLDDYGLVDSRISFRKNRLGVFIDVNNILNTSYQETNLVVMPGRWAKAGIDVKIF